MSIQAWLAVVFGFVFIAMMAAVAIWLTASQRDPPPQAMFFFRVIIALAAAGIGVVLPGLLNVTFNGAGIAVSATAGLALFVIVYFVNPPSVVTHKPEVGKLTKHKREPPKPPDPPLA